MTTVWWEHEDYHVVKVGNIMYSVKMLRELHECGLLDEFSYQRYKKLAKPFDPSVTYGLDHPRSEK
jgi:hypothetical protein